jgi:hypothetical protein
MKIDFKNRNLRPLLSFIVFCYEHREMRFWQALTAWSGYARIEAVKGDQRLDTFYWEGRDHNV